MKRQDETYKVGSSQLLQSLQRHSQQRTVCHSRARENLIPLVLAASSEFGIEFSLNLTHLTLNFPVTRSNTIRASNRGASTFDIVMAIIPSRALREEADSSNHKHWRDEAHAHRDTPSGRIIIGFGAVVDAVCHEDAERDEELVATHHGTSDMAWCRLGLVHGGENG